MGSVQEATKSVQASKLKVLIADDDAPTRILLRAAIAQWGYEVAETKDGQEAWELMQTPNAPRLLIVDWLMPRLNGIDLCERIKKEMPLYAYIILLTQQSGTTNLIKGLEAGADEFLSKPFNMAELRSRLSIGARIVRYENELSASNARLKNYINSIDVYNLNALEMLKENQIEKTKKELEEIQDVVKKYRFEESTRKQD